MFVALRNFIESITGPLIWSLSLLPPLMLNMITAACAGVIVVFAFGFFLFTSKVLFPAPQPIIVCLTEQCTPMIATSHGLQAIDQESLRLE